MFIYVHDVYDVDDVWSKWGVPKMGIPQNEWFIMENLVKMDDNWGYSYFRKPPYL